MSATLHDVEKGVPQVHDSHASPFNGHPSQAQSQHGGRTPLEIFQSLVGIITSSQLGGSNNVVRPRLHIRRIFFPPRSEGGKNTGLYQRAINEEWKNRMAYMATSYILNSVYILQILLAATFTGLSAYQDRSSVSLTVLGAINTVIAGFLAWLKGQGVPNRFRRARDQYSQLVDRIETTERLFAEYDYIVINPTDGEEAPDPKTEADKLQKMFETARQDQQNNYPDTYVSSRDTAGHIGNEEEMKEDMQKTVDAMRTDFAKRESDLVERLRHLEVTLEVPQTNEHVRVE